MSLTLHQPNLPSLSSSHPCGQSWHHTSNVDISLLLKPRERDREPDDNDIDIDDSKLIHPLPISPIRTRSQDCDAIPSPPQSVARVVPSSISTPSTISKQHLQQTEHSPSLAPPPSLRPTTTTTSVIPAKRSASHLNASSNTSTSAHRTIDSQSHPAKKQSKWSPYEDSKIISLRADGMKWEDISRHLPGRSAISCRLHYQNYLERRSEWDEDRKDRLARLYERFKQEMWSKIAEEMAIPWRAAEAMHWQIGEHDMARRAGVTPFSLTNTSSNTTSSHNNHGGGGNGSSATSRSTHSHTHHRHFSRSNAPNDGPESYPRLGAQQLPSLAELTAGLPAFHHPIQPLLPGPGLSLTPAGYTYAHSHHGHGHTHSHSLSTTHDTRTTPETPYSSGLPYPGQSLIPSPGSLRGADFFLKRS